LSRRGRRVSPATLFFVLLSLALAAALYWKSRAPEPVPAPPALPSPRPSPHPTRSRSPRSERTPEPSPLHAGAPRIALVIDDLGNELASAERIARWREPVAGAVLPDLPHSAAAARALAAGGKEILLHLPMEPEGYPRIRPGPGVILRSQSDAEIVRALDADLESVPGAVGVNNHMGSAATADPRVMRAVAGVLARRGLFFVDSRTTDATVAETVAEATSVPAVSRRVFLDDVPTENAVRAQLAELVRRAKQEKAAVAIGHPYAVTLGVLERELGNLRREGVEIVRVSELAK